MNWRLKRIWELLAGMFKRGRRLSDQEQWDAWQDLISRARQEILYAFANRRNFREIRKIYEANAQLQSDGAHVYSWLSGMHGRDQVLAVRREVDRDSRVINIAQLLVQIMNRPAVLSRARYRCHFSEFHVMGVDIQDEQFTRMAGPGPFIDPDLVKKDRNRLWKKTQKVVNYANLMVAHRATAEVTLTFKDLDDAMDAIEKMFQKYYVLLTGNAMTGAEPAVQYNWSAPFEHAWIQPPRGE